MLTYRSQVLLLATLAATGSTACVATGSSECFVGANTAFEADAAGKRCCEAPNGTWGACPEQLTGSTTSGIGTSTSTTTTTTTDWTSTTTLLDTDTSSTTGATPVCGDGVPQDPEKCDPACLAHIDSPQALKDCTANSNCRLDCKWADGHVECGDNSCADLAECGDGLVNAPEGMPEQCDDGNGKNGDGCTGDCRHERCGDQIVNAPGGVKEECDDGNSDDGDDCTNDCTVARCGDGTLRKGKEECDDGGLEDFDGCSQKCQKEWVIFVTRQTYPGDMGSIENANGKCAEAVDGKEGRPKFDGMYVAWLSVNGQLAKDLLPSERKLIDTKGDTIVDDAAHLIDTVNMDNDGPKKAIDLDEKGMPVLGWVWTGTKPDGTTSMGGHCQGWTTLEATAYAGTTAKKEKWEDPGDWTSVGTFGCGESYHLYCFRADK